VDRMCSSIREFGFKIPVLAKSDGTVIDGHLRLKAARKRRMTEVPVLLCDEWSDAQVKAFRLLVNRSATWADFDDELLALELQELNEADFDLSLTGFDPGEIDALLVDPEDDEKANAAPPLPENAVSRLGDLWLCGPHRVLCGDATSGENVARLLGDRKPALMVTDPPYGIELDSEWCDRAGPNGGDFGSKRTKASKARAAADPQYHAEPSYMKHRTEGHTETTISGNTKADWSEAFALVPSLQIAYVWYASIFTREVLDGLLRIGFLYPQQIIWNKGRVVLTRTHYWYQHEPCRYVRKKKLAAAELTERVCCGLELDPKYGCDCAALGTAERQEGHPRGGWPQLRRGLQGKEHGHVITPMVVCSCTGGSNPARSEMNFWCTNPGGTSATQL